MAPTARRMSTLTQKLSSEEEWQELIDWGGELFDPLFQGDVGIANTDTSINNTFRDSFNSNVLESAASENFYTPSPATPTFEGPSSFDYVLSSPPSVTEGPNSFDHGRSWLSGSPSYTTSATSPMIVQAGLPYQESAEASETMLYPGHIPPPSPFLDAHSYGSASSYQTAPTSGLLNPHVAGTPHFFSGLDVYASQALLGNLGAWAEPNIEPIMEVHQEDSEGAMPIPIPHNGPPRPSNISSPHPWNDHLPNNHLQSGPARAITIPQPRLWVPSIQSDSLSGVPLERHHPSLRQPSQNRSRRVPPVLSASPEQRRVPRNVPLSRSLPKPRRRNERLATPSPTSNISGWVSYQPNTQHRLVPRGAEGSHRRQRGRVGALRPEQRSHAALMRVVGSCSNCKKRKEKCDPGTPCKSCIEHFKGDLVNHPCRDRLVSELASVFLAKRHGWHPTARAIEACLGEFEVAPGSHPIPMIFGFGPVLHVTVSLVHPKNFNNSLLHRHAVYSWPPDSSPPHIHTHAVLPAILTAETMGNLEGLLDAHLSLLVDHHFHSFPPFCSPLRVLRHIYVYYRSLSPSTSHSRLLHQALKLLVLVHVGGDITLPLPSSDPILEHLVQSIDSIPNRVTPTPCFIRSQFGFIMPSLALKLMRETLLSLEQILLNRADEEWHFAVATLLLVLVTIESIQYHATKVPYHSPNLDPSEKDNDEDDDGGEPMELSGANREKGSSGDEEGVRQLLEFYAACFAGCHARLHPEWTGDSLRPRNAKSNAPLPEDKFIKGIRQAVRDATPEYMEAKAAVERDGEENGEDMGFFFDRLAARFLLLRPHFTAQQETS